MYDIIGDIHGHAHELVGLLHQLGYKMTDGCYRHPHHRVIFLGDFIDSGPQQRATLAIVMAMVNKGAALSVMGNHELNAIAYHTLKEDGSGHYLRPHTKQNYKQHQAFLTAYDDYHERTIIIEWFKTLPLWLDLEQCRVVHACWDQRTINYVSEQLSGAQFSAATLTQALTYQTPLFTAVERLLKGVETTLPQGLVHIDNYGIERTTVRVKWWLSGAMPFNQVIVDHGVAEHLIQPISANVLPGYTKDNKPLFIGHYWRTGDPAVLLSNLACDDYSVANNGHLIAYRFQGEGRLNDTRFYRVNAVG